MSKENSAAMQATLVPHFPRKSLLSLLLATALAPMAISAQAQSSPTTPSAANDPAAAEQNNKQTVYVTATRRREPARDVPIQVGILKTDELRSAGADRLADYLSNEPGIDITGQGDKGKGTVTIRGVTTGFDFNPTVGIYVDEVAVGASSGYGAASSFDLNLLDLDHIEVYRGPQGTLYGTGAMGGLIKYVTNQASTTEFSGNVGASLSSTSHGGLNKSLNTVLNIPLQANTAAMRASVFYRDNKGFIDSTGPFKQNHLNNESASGGRLSLLFTPNKQWNVRLNATTQEIKHDGSDWVNMSATGQNVVGDLQRTLNMAEPFKQQVNLFSFDVEYDMGWARFNSVSSYQTIRNTNTLDFSAYNGILKAAFGINTVATDLTNQRDTNKYAQEFRLTSAASKQFEWLAGLYMTKENSYFHQDLATRLANGSSGPFPLVASLDTTYKEYAAFGTMTYYATPQLALIAGGRISPNRQTYRQDMSGVLAAKNGPAAESSESSKTWMMTARYSLDTHSHVYLRAATGYRAGGINPNSINPATGGPVSKLPTFKSDSLREIELGYKGRFLNNQLQLETALYNINWKDIQLTDIVSGFFTYVNGGRARINGFDFALTGRATENLQISAKFSAIDNQLVDDAPSIGGKAGDRTPNTAKFAAALGANYSFNFSGKPAYIGLQQRYVGERESSLPGNLSSPNYKLPAYSLTDMSAGMEWGNTKVSLFIRNAFDKRGQMAAFTSLVPFGANAMITDVQPRTLGVTANMAF